MTFLSPLLLWGLLASSIPVIIHLFSLRHTKEIEFSSLNSVSVNHEDNQPTPIPLTTQVRGNE